MPLFGGREVREERKRARLTARAERERWREFEAQFQKLEQWLARGWTSSVPTSAVWEEVTEALVGLGPPPDVQRAFARVLKAWYRAAAWNWWNSQRAALTLPSPMPAGMWAWQFVDVTSANPTVGDLQREGLEASLRITQASKPCAGLDCGRKLAYGQGYLEQNVIGGPIPGYPEYLTTGLGLPLLCEKCTDRILSSPDLELLGKIDKGIVEEVPRHIRRLASHWVSTSGKGA
jgi:hypothetical protein